MTGREPVGSIGRTSDSGSGEEDIPDFIRCVDGRDPQIHEVWDFGDDDVTCEVHLSVQVDVSTGVVEGFTYN